MSLRRQGNRINFRETRTNFPVFRGGAGLPTYKGSRRYRGGPFYSTPSYMSGGGIIYKGSRPRFRGGSFFGSLRTSLAPIGRQALQGMKNLAKNETVRNMAKAAAKRGAELLTTVAVDALQGRNAAESFKERSKELALRTLTGADNHPPPAKKRRSNKTKKAKKVLSAPSSSSPKALKQSRKRGKKQSRKLPATKKRKLSRASLNRKNLF